MSSPRRRVVFLDRDGTINVDHGYIHRWDDWTFLPGAVDALKQLCQHGYWLVVVTNQSGVGRGYYSEQDVHALHERVDAILCAADVAVAAYFYCPHVPEQACECRKPNTGMVRHWLREHEATLDLAASWMIGDRNTDIEFGRNLGVRTILLDGEERAMDGCRPDVVCRDLAAASALICQIRRQPA